MIGGTIRNLNEAADALSNGVFDGFDLAKRVVPVLPELPFLVLPDIMLSATQLFEEIKLRKTAAQEAKLLEGPVDSKKHGHKRKRRTTVPLRQSDPW